MASTSTSKSSRSPGRNAVRFLLTFVLWAVCVGMAVITAVAIYRGLGTPLAWLKMTVVSVVFGVLGHFSERR